MKQINYYAEFLRFKKYTGQIDTIVRSLERSIRNTHGPLAFVDIGANDGELTNGILEVLKNKNGKVSLYATEPDISPYRKLKSRFAKIEYTQVDNFDFKSWLNRYSNRLKNSVDILLNSHTFYHYPERTWKNLIAGGSRLLGEEGKHYIIIDSANSSINKLWPVIKNKMKNTLKIKEFGEYLTGKDLLRFLNNEKIGYSRIELKKEFAIPRNKLSKTGVARILGFVFRYRAEDLLKYCGREITEFIKKHKKSDSYLFIDRQDLIILKKYDPIS